MSAVNNNQRSKRRVLNGERQHELHNAPKRPASSSQDCWRLVCFWIGTKPAFRPRLANDLTLKDLLFAWILHSLLSFTGGRQSRKRPRPLGGTADKRSRRLERPSDIRENFSSRVLLYCELTVVVLFVRVRGFNLTGFICGRLE